MAMSDMRQLLAMSVLVLILAGLPARASDAPAARGHRVPPETAEPALPRGPLGADVVPVRYRLDMTIVPDADTFSGAVAIDVEIAHPSRVIWLHGKGLDVREVRVESGGRRIDARYREVDPTGVARLDLDAPPAAGPARIEFVYRAPFGEALDGLYRVVDRGEAYAFTQFQATSARQAFPGFDDPRFKTPFEIHVTARPSDAVITTTPEVGAAVIDAVARPSDAVITTTPEVGAAVIDAVARPSDAVITTTPEAGAVRVADGRVRHTFAVTPPLPTYLIAFAVGPLDVVPWAPVPPDAERSEPLPLRGVATRGKGERLEFALANTAPIVTELEKYFGTPMPFPKLDILAVPDFASGAMENVGAITYREQYLLLGAAPSLAEKRWYVSLHAHELAHQWFGNLVTPKWWDDVWLNESFANWMAAKVAPRAFPALGMESDLLSDTLGVMRTDALASARQIRQPVPTNLEVSETFDGITYAKGAAVLAMLEGWIGEDAFRAGVQLHLRRFAHGVADAQDFLRSMADGAGERAVTGVLQSFLFQPGVPLVRARLDCAAERPAIELAQSRYLPRGSAAPRDATWQIPVCVRYGTVDGGAVRQCERIATPSARMTLPAGPCPAWVMPNASGSGYYRVALDGAGWKALFGHLGALDVSEVRTLQGSLAAAFRSGDANAETLMDSFDVFAAHSAWEVALAPVDDLNLLRSWLATTPAARAGVEARVRALYGKRLEALGLVARSGESPGDALLRAGLGSAVAVIGRDPAVRAALMPAAENYLETGGTVSGDLDRGLVSTALRVAVEDRGATFADPLLAAALESDDATFRQRALSALAASPDAALGQRLRGLLFDPRLRDAEAGELAQAQAANEYQRDAMWAWIREDANRDGLLARMPSWTQSEIVWLGAGSCDAARADALGAWFQPLADRIEGGPRALAQATESIRLCAALAAAEAGPVTAWFERVAAATATPG
jgi:alanyl aminopeptidase